MPATSVARFGWSFAGRATSPETMVPEKQVSDFVLEADLEADPANGHSALALSCGT